MRWNESGPAETGPVKRADPLQEKDMLLVQIAIKGSHEVLATMPHVVTIKELKTGAAAIDLCSTESLAWYYPFHAGSPFRPPCAIST